MKKIFVSILAVSVLAACSEEINPNPGNDNKLPKSELTVGVTAEDGTKATWDNDLKSYWEENDRIAVLQGYAPSSEPVSADVLDITDGVGENSAKFGGSVTDYDVTEYFHAVYPASSTLQVRNYGEKSVTTCSLVIPSTQTGVYQPCMYAASSSALTVEGLAEETLAFKTLNAAVTVRSDKKLKSLTLTATGAYPAGTFNGQADGGAAIESFDFSGSSYSITASGLETIAKVGDNYEYTLAIAPAAYESLTISLTDEADAVLEKEAGALEIEANHRKGYSIVWETEDIEAVDLSDPTGSGNVETANCYVVGQAGTTYRFPATVMGNGATTPADADYVPVSKPNNLAIPAAPGITPSALAPKSARILWQTAPSLLTEVRLINGHVVFTSNGEKDGTLTEGNAVIAVYSGDNATGDILWSWHIWVTDADIESGLQTWKVHSDLASYSAYQDPQLMDRNLGATTAEDFATSGSTGSYGLYYNWGRKDPFIGVDDSSASSEKQRTTYDCNGKTIGSHASVASIDAASNNAWQYVGSRITIEQAIKYPMLRPSMGNDTWMSSSVFDLWGLPGYDAGKNTIGSKTIYDPCPPGYRVMNPYAMSGIASTTAGGSVTENGGTVSHSIQNMSDFHTNHATYTKSLQVKINDNGDIANLPVSGYLWKTAYDRTGNYGGYYWTTQASNGSSYNGVRLEFDYNNIRPVSSGKTIIAQSVRCEKIK